MSLSRRDFFGVAAAGGVGASLAATMRGLHVAVAAEAIGPQERAVRKPNFVIVLADDHGTDDAGCYGAKGLRTPNIDRLAAEGMRFTRAFTATAMCAPSRSMLYTGLFPHRNGAHPNHSKVRPGIQSLPHHLSKLGYRVALAGKTHIGPRSAFPFEYMDRGKVDTFLAEAGSQPFCLVIATNDPHAPWKKKGPYDAAKVVLPPYLLDTPETREAMACYWNSVAALDTQVGQFLALLKKHGLEDSTLFLYTSDHGSGFPFTKWTLYDAGIRVPFIVRWPGHARPGSVTDAMVSFVDVLPTFIEAAGQKPPEDLDGRSFLGVLWGRAVEHRDAIFATHTNKGIISGSEYPIRAIRTRTHKYIVNLNPAGTFKNIVTEGREGPAGKPAGYWLSWRELARTDADAAKRARLYQHRPAEELYDLAADPFELNSLAADPANRPLMADLRQQLKAWMKQQNDPLLARMG